MIAAPAQHHARPCPCGSPRRCPRRRGFVRGPGDSVGAAWFSGRGWLRGMLRWVGNWACPHANAASPFLAPSSRHGGRETRANHESRKGKNSAADVARRRAACPSPPLSPVSPRGPGQSPPPRWVTVGPAAVEWLGMPQPVARPRGPAAPSGAAAAALPAGYHPGSRCCRAGRSNRSEQREAFPRSGETRAFLQRENIIVVCGSALCWQERGG